MPSSTVYAAMQRKFQPCAGRVRSAVQSLCSLLRCSAMIIIITIVIIIIMIIITTTIKIKSGWIVQAASNC